MFDDIWRALYWNGHHQKKSSSSRFLKMNGLSVQSSLMTRSVIQSMLIFFKLSRLEPRMIQEKHWIYSEKENVDAFEEKHVLAMRPSINLAKNIKWRDPVFALMNCEVIEGMTSQFYNWIFKQLLSQYFFFKIHTVEPRCNKGPTAFFCYRQTSVIANKENIGNKFESV